MSRTMIARRRRLPEFDEFDPEALPFPGRLIEGAALLRKKRNRGGANFYARGARCARIASRLNGETGRQQPEPTRTKPWQLPSRNLLRSGLPMRTVLNLVGRRGMLLQVPRCCPPGEWHRIWRAKPCQIDRT